MERAQAKVEEKRKLVEDAERDAKNAKKELKATKTQTAMNVYEKKKKTVERLKDQLAKLEMGWVCFWLGAFFLLLFVSIIDFTVLQKCFLCQF